MVQRPSYFDPRRHPERAIVRRNLVLTLMRQNGYITAAQEKAAASAPVRHLFRTLRAWRRALFLPLVTEELEGILGPGKAGDNSYRVYTTLDERMQHAAVEAVRMGMQEVDALLRRKRNQDRPFRRSSSGARGSRRAYGRDQSPGRRTRLQVQPAQPRSFQEAARFGFQAVCLCCGTECHSRTKPLPVHAVKHD